jgi:SAM-dependent methyltransferase
MLDGRITIEDVREMQSQKDMKQQHKHRLPSVYWESWNRKQAEKRAKVVHLRSAAKWNNWASQHYPPCPTSLDGLEDAYAPLINHNGWLYGVWICDLSSPDFMSRITNLFAGPEGWEETGWLHVSGEPPVPFEAETLNVIFSNPHIDDDQGIGRGERKPPPYPIKKLVDEAYRTLKPGGYFALLHVYTGPPRSNKKWISRATIAVAAALQCKRTRTLSVIQKMVELT